jgi:stage V sporulation protein S
MGANRVQEPTPGMSNSWVTNVGEPSPRGGRAMEVLKVSSKSNPNSVAGAMAGVVRQEGVVEVQVVGAGALNQAIKALAIARGYVAPSGIDLVCIPTFADIQIDGERRTAIRLSIEDRMHRRSEPLPLAIDGTIDVKDVPDRGNGHRADQQPDRQSASTHERELTR